MGLTGTAPCTPTGTSTVVAHGTWQEEVHRLAAERDAVVLAHNYMTPEIQDVAHHVGDSLALSRIAAETDASTIVFCGVHFMAETAKILSPDKTVLVPTAEAGCSLADSIDAEQLRAWKAEHPDAVVVAYVNTTAEVKAETDICCTSSNAVEVVSVDPGRHRGALPARPVPRRARAPRDRARQPARLARRVPRPRRHQARRRPRPGRRPPRGRAAGAPRVRLRHLGPVARRRGRPCPAGRTQILSTGGMVEAAATMTAAHRAGRHRGRHAAPAAPGQLRRRRSCR